ncbi:MAG: hypothetical protein RR639_06970, partial [Hydrogenoanaerobacterium sp.]
MSLLGWRSRKVLAFFSHLCKNSLFLWQNEQALEPWGFARKRHFKTQFSQGLEVPLTTTKVSQFSVYSEVR